MISRPSNLESISVNFEFNFQRITCLEIDLVHVNKNGRSKLTSKDVATIVESLVKSLILTASDEKEFGDEFCSYFVKRGEVESIEYKLVFCICSDRPTTLGVITLHRV